MIGCRCRTAALALGRSSRWSTRMTSFTRQCTTETGIATPLRHFGEQRVRPWLAGALRASGYSEPTPVQTAAMDRVAHHHNTVIHAETGSGKTLAYLVPILSRLDAGRPLQLLILLPSRELALQVAHEVDRLLVPESGLAVKLVVDGADQKEKVQRELADDVTAKRADILVATPHALSRALRTRARPARRSPASATHLAVREEAESDYGAELLLTMATNLDAIILDEVDALLPKPVLNAQLGYYRQRDWAKATRMQRHGKRPGAKSGSVTGQLVQRILTASEVVRAPSNAMLADKSRHEKSASDRHAARSSKSSQLRRAVHLVAASATVSRGVIMQLRSLWGGKQSLDVIGPDGKICSGPPSKASEKASAESRKSREPGQRGVAGVGVPPTIMHRVLGVTDESGLPLAAAQALQSLQPRAALIVLPDGTPVNAWARRLTEAGLPQVQLLHEAMGFSSRRGTPDALWEQQSPATLLDRVQRVRQATSSDREATSLPMRVLLTTECSVRGIDLPGLDCVVMLYVPLTSDTYAHVAGRTGRGLATGTALTIVPEQDANKVGMFTSQLGISIKRVPLAVNAENRDNAASCAESHTHSRLDTLE